MCFGGTEFSQSIHVVRATHVTRLLDGANDDHQRTPHQSFTAYKVDIIYLYILLPQWLIDLYALLMCGKTCSHVPVDFRCMWIFLLRVIWVSSKRLETPRGAIFCLSDINKIWTLFADDVSSCNKCLNYWEKTICICWIILGLQFQRNIIFIHCSLERKSLFTFWNLDDIACIFFYVCLRLTEHWQKIVMDIADYEFMTSTAKYL